MTSLLGDAAVVLFMAVLALGLGARTRSAEPEPRTQNP